MSRGEIIYPTKFQSLIGRAKQAIGAEEYAPEIYLDASAILQCLFESNVWRTLHNLNPKSNVMSLKWDIDEGFPKGAWVKVGYKSSGKTV